MEYQIVTLLILSSQVDVREHTLHQKTILYLKFQMLSFLLEHNTHPLLAERP